MPALLCNAPVALLVECACCVNMGSSSFISAFHFLYCLKKFKQSYNSIKVNSKIDVLKFTFPKIYISKKVQISHLNKTPL